MGEQSERRRGFSREFKMEAVRRMEERHGAIFEFIETWYNVARLHSTLGY